MIAFVTHIFIEFYCIGRVCRQLHIITCPELGKVRKTTRRTAWEVCPEDAAERVVCVYDKNFGKNVMQMQP